MSESTPRLPPEILAKIFRHTMDKSRTLQLPPKLFEAPWTLRRVCSSWRQIALQEHQLWSNISLSIHPPSRSSEDYAYIREIISPNGPLSITASATLPVNDDVLEELVLSRLDRITELHLDASIPPSSAFWKLNPRLFSSVQDISFVLYDYRTSNAISLPPEDIHIFDSARHLKKLKIVIECTDWFHSQSHIHSFRTPPMPWSQLTDIELKVVYSRKPIRGDAIYRILLQCHALESLTVDIDFDITGTSKSSTLNENPSLPYLTSVSLRKGFLTEFMNLGLPWAQLKTLRLVGFENSRHAELAFAIFKSTVYLESLDFLILHSSLSKINRLELGSQVITFSYLHTLLITDHDLPLLSLFSTPKLEKLVITDWLNLDRDSYDDNFPAEQVMRFLRRSGCSIKHFGFGLITQPDRNQKVIESFLASPSLESLQTWDVPFTCLDDKIVEKIGKGELLSKLRTFYTKVQSPSVFVNAMEKRVEKLGSSLREGSASVNRRDMSPESKYAANRRLDRLNSTFSTNFKLT